MNDLSAKKVLILDDDVELCRVWSATFRDAPYEVRVLTDPNEALTLAREACGNGRPFDLFLIDLDLNHREHTGISVAEALRAGPCKARIVFVTGYEIDEDIQFSADVLKVFAIWKKPPRDLRKQVESTLSMPDDYTVDRREKEPRPVRSTLRETVTVRIQQQGIVYGIYVLLALSIAIQSFNLWRSNYTAPAIMEMHDYILNKPQAAEGNDWGNK